MIYFDHNATTAVLPEVREAMLPMLGGNFGNPSSIHAPGRLARNALDDARGAVAELAGVHPRQVVFTSGGTESNALALRGVALQALATGAARRRLLVGSTEHAAVRDEAFALRRLGFTVEEVPVAADGHIDLPAYRSLLDDEVLLVSLMAANNETGVLTDIAPLAELAHAAGAVFHCDAVQLPGKQPFSMAELGADLASISGHKIGAPKGVGALLLAGAVELFAGQHGGGQEAGLRSGTENLPGIVGFGVAATHAVASQAEFSTHTRQLRDQLERGLAAIPGITLFAAASERLPNTCQFGVAGYAGDTVQMGLDRAGFAVSTGSACHSGDSAPSHVLTAMGVPPDAARSAIRVTFGLDNTHEQVNEFLGALENLRGALPSQSAGGAVGW
ncbi:MAG: cysteine desulfurase family protein [Gammaproteobacteria bacterium]|nr:cysteine desulfurase family protein [Gammaproteobacteria bacterium]